MGMVPIASAPWVSILGRFYITMEAIQPKTCAQKVKARGMYQLSQIALHGNATGNTINHICE